MRPRLSLCWTLRHLRPRQTFMFCHGILRHTVVKRRRFLALTIDERRRQRHAVNDVILCQFVASARFPVSSSTDHGVIPLVSSRKDVGGLHRVVFHYFFEAGKLAHRPRFSKPAEVKKFTCAKFGVDRSRAFCHWPLKIRLSYWKFTSPIKHCKALTRCNMKLVKRYRNIAWWRQISTVPRSFIRIKFFPIRFWRMTIVRSSLTLYDRWKMSADQDEMMGKTCRIKFIKQKD